MKKIITLVLVLIFAITCIAVPAGYTGGVSVKMYAPDGRDIMVPIEDVEAYMGVGWYKNPVTVLYSMDFREIVVEIDEKEEYMKVGWFEEPFHIMYAPDGREITVEGKYVDAYVSVGWYTEPVLYMYSRDGRCLVVLKRELEAYKNVGWYDDINIISKIMVSPDGIETRVFSDYYIHYYNLGYRFKGRENLDVTKPMVALTFDDGPSQQTMRIVSCLLAYNSVATFFCVGQNVDAMRQTVRSVRDFGMEIGNHSYSHPDLAKLKPDGIRWQMDACSNAIYNAIGEYPSLCRPPYGSIGKDVLPSVGMPSILWAIDTLDWQTRNAEKTVEAILSSVKDGDIILMHDLYKETADAVEIVVPKLIEAGFQLVTVSELAQFRNQTLTSGMKYHRILK
ncbi:MAG: polysaccharide deacetylase family protein [Clostridia bacterium]|nr:polysaccharide deacetylase family protein [Clostridia bacterium]